MIQRSERSGRGWRAMLAVAVMGLPLFAASCAGDDDDDATPATTAAATATSTAAGEVLTLGGTRFANHGTEDVAGKAEVEVVADNFFFSPTFLRGEPGQKMTVSVKNASAANHSFTIVADSIDQDVPAGTTATVEVTFPDSGVLLFACKYHTDGGMNGELLAGSAEPQAPAGAAATPGATGTADSGSGGTYDY